MGTDNSVHPILTFTCMSLRAKYEPVKIDLVDDDNVIFHLKDGTERQITRFDVKEHFKALTGVDLL